MIKKLFPRVIFLLSFIAMALAISGCQTAYYGTMEKFGVHKRDILVDRVKEARDVQEETKDQFQSALERFKAETGFTGGELEKRYDALKSEFDQCEEKATAVKNKINSVENVAKALFAEWSDELNQYTNPKLKAASLKKLENTKKQYSRLISAMKHAESKTGIIRLPGPGPLPEAQSQCPGHCVPAKRTGVCGNRCRCTDTRYGNRHQ